MSTRALLLDGDIPAYSFAAASEKPIRWPSGLWTLHAEEEPTAATLDSFIERIGNTLEADRVIIALSDSENFRYDVLPTYKHNRRNTRQPMLRQFLKDYMIENYETYIRPGLEGDDVLGILATSTKIVEEDEKIVCTIDKDLATIPGLHYRWAFDPFYGTEADPEIEDERFRTVDEEEADYWWLCQTLAGDITDGYKGCPSIGMDTAQKLMTPDEDGLYYAVAPQEYTRKGEPAIKWVKYPTDDRWEMIVSYFAKAGFGEEEAITQARVARILRVGDYDFKKKRVILWSPS